MSSSRSTYARPAEGGDEWTLQFERRIRDVASRAVAHLKRGDGVTIATTAGDRVRADRSVGADRILRFLALVEAVLDEHARRPSANARAPLAFAAGIATSNRSPSARAKP